MKKYMIRILIIMGVIFPVGLFFSETLLIGVYRNLVHDDPLVKSEAIVVLAGSRTGNRIKEAAKLYHDGYGKKIVFSGFKFYPETYTSTLMKKYALMLGVPEKDIITELSSEEASTRGESISNLRLLKKNQIKKFILVTTAWHTRRAKLIYERTNTSLRYNLEYIVHPAPDPLAPTDGWWKLRTGQKAMLYEYIKSVAYYLRL